MARTESAAQALAKLLGKLQLIPEETAIAPFKVDEFFPLTYFARQGLYDENEAIRKVADKLTVPVFTVTKETAAQVLLLLDHERLQSVSLGRWRDMRAIPVDIAPHQVTVAMANPLDLSAQESLKFDLGCRITLTLAREDDILALLAKKLHSTNIFDLEDILTSASTTDVQTQGNSPTADLESNLSTSDLEAPPVVKIVNRILSEAVEMEASDIHINPEKDSVAVRVRVDGIMHALLTIPANLKSPVVSRLKLLSGMDIAEKRKPQDGRLRIKTGFGIKDLRFSTVPTLYGENLVIRILASDLEMLSFSKIGMPGHMQTALENLLRGSSRVVVVTGPTGSGKSSTLYTSLLHVRDGTRNIVSIEDPIEYRISGVNQIQVNPKIGVTFAEGLRAVLRQDPDIIMVGEIRDFETASICLQAAQTGHLVLTSLHTNAAAGAFTRLRDLGIPPYAIASGVGCILAQRLVRKLCPACSEAAPGTELEQYKQLGLDAACVKVSRGCDECGGDGYRGRVGVYSLIQIDDPVRDAIRETLGESEIEQRARASGFQSLHESALELIRNGITSIDEVERVLGVFPHGTGDHGLHSQQGAPSQGISKPRILLVEDDENTRTVLALLLERELYEVIEAHDGLEALESLYQHPPSLIVLDMMMPRMGGVEFLKRMRSDTRTRNIPVLMLTAADTDANQLRSFEVGADDFVSKTADSKIMLARVQRLLTRSSDVAS